MGDLEALIPPAKQSNRGGRPRTVDMGRYSIRCSLSTAVAANGICSPTIGSPQAPSMTLLSSGATMGHGKKWSRHCVSRPACKRGASPRLVPSASIAQRSRPPRWVVPSVGRRAARRSTGASGICRWIRWACYWPSLLPVPVSMMASRHRPCSVTSRHTPCRVAAQCCGSEYRKHALDVWMAAHRGGWRIEVKARPAGTKGFTPLEKRWVIERTMPGTGGTAGQQGL